MLLHGIAILNCVHELIWLGGLEEGGACSQPHTVHDARLGVNTHAYTYTHTNTKYRNIYPSKT